MHEKPPCPKSFGAFYGKLVKILGIIDFQSPDTLFNLSFSNLYEKLFELFTFNFNNFDLTIQLSGANNKIIYI